MTAGSSYLHTSSWINTKSARFIRQEGSKTETFIQLAHRETTLPLFLYHSVISGGSAAVHKQIRYLNPFKLLKTVNILDISTKKHISVGATF